MGTGKFNAGDNANGGKRFLCIDLMKFMPILVTCLIISIENN